VLHLALLVNLHAEQLPDHLFPTLNAQLAAQLSTVERLPTLPPSHANFYTQISLAQSYIALLRSTPAVTIPSSTEIIALLTQVQQQAAGLNDTQSQSHALGTLGKLYEQLAQQRPELLQQAQQATQAALRLADQADHIAYQWQWQLGRIYAAQQDGSRAIAAYQTAVATLQTLRQDLIAIESGAQFSFRDTVEPLYRELVALLLGQLADVAPSNNNLLQAIQEIDALQLTQLENFLSCNLTETFALSEPQLDTSTAIIYPIILPNQVAVILRLPQSNELQFHRVAIPETDVVQRLTQLRQQAENRYLSDSFWDLSGQVYDWLIRPFESALAQQQIQTLVFVSDGALRNVPMAVLSKDQRFLIEDYAIALSPGLQLPQAQPLSQIKLGAMVSDRPSAIAYGLSDIRTDFSPHQGFAPLANVETELAAIEAQVGSRQFLNQAFTRKALQALGVNYTAPIVHLATHGQFSADPKETFLLAWDRRITLDDFSNLLDNQGSQTAIPIELLILSACKTSDGDNRATLGLAGIAIQSGARSTIASLWSVDDQATADIMQHLYQQLGQLTPSSSRADILRQAQIELLKTPGYQAPFYWAPYVLVGNWS
ncbi:MAG: CHAT domain-containing protein, partial [Cyanobacteria bacterium P01_D01_bin.44]